MKEYVFVEFVFGADEEPHVHEILRTLGTDFEIIGSNATVTSTNRTTYVAGKIHSAAATALKLCDPFLADRMRISYISDELKDKYRNR